MKATIIKATCKSGVREFPGWIVPDTEDLFAVDERCPADLDSFEEASWTISHIPSGFAVRAAYYTDASTKERAIEIAQAFYREWKARGWPLTSSDAEVIVGQYRTLSDAEKKALWLQIAGRPETETGDRT